jgi:membrane protein required for colicin V production
MNWTAWNWADWTILAILGVSCLISLMRGFVREALSLASWLAASFVAITFHDPFASVLARWVETPSIRAVLAYAALFIGTLLIGTLINYLIGSLLRSAGLGGFDRILGLAFGLARGLLIVLAIVILLPMALPVNQDAWWRQSALIPQFEVMDGWARHTFARSVYVGEKWIKNARSSSSQTSEAPIGAPE